MVTRTVLTSSCDNIWGFTNDQVPKGLQRRIRTFYEYLWDSGQDSYSSALFEEMPEKLRLQLNLALKKRLIEKARSQVMSSKRPPSRNARRELTRQRCRQKLE